MSKTSRRGQRLFSDLMKRAKRSGRSKPLQFLAKAQKDRKLSDRVLAGVERGGKVTAEEVMQIAKEFGFKFTRKLAAQPLSSVQR